MKENQICDNSSYFKNDHTSFGKLTYSYVLIFVSALFLFYKYLLQIMPSVITDQLMSTYDLTGTGLGFLAGTYFYSYMVMQIPAGMLLDKYSIRRLTTVAIGICALGAFLFYSTSNYWMACLARALIGFGAAFATVSYMKLASVWFSPKHFSLLSGFFGTACMFGAGCAEILIAWTTQRYGWRQMVLFSAVMGIVLCVSFYLIIKDKEEKPNQTFYKENNIWNALKLTFSNKYNYPLILYSGLAFIPVAVFGGLWGVPYLQQAYHLTKSISASSASLVFFGFGIGGPLFGWLSDHFSKRKPILIAGTVISLLFLMIVLYVPHLSLFMLRSAIFLFGFFNSVFLISYTLGKEINSLSITATVIGVINSGDAICGAVAEPLVGKILDLGWDGKMIGHIRIFSTHDYHVALSVLSIYVFLSIVSAIFIKETKAKQLV